MKTLPVLAVLIAAFALPAGASSSRVSGGTALSASASIDLRIVVPHMLELRLLDQPPTIEVTAADAANGQVEVSGPRVSLLSTDRRGYWIDGALQGPFTEATVEGLAAPLYIGEGGGRALMPSMVGKPRPEPMRVHLRLRLREGTPPGTYRWPVALSIQSP